MSTATSDKVIRSTRSSCIIVDIIDFFLHRHGSSATTSTYSLPGRSIGEAHIRKRLAGYCVLWFHC